MRRILFAVCMVLLLMGGACRCWAQSQNDPLTDDQVDKVRDAADRPNDRIKLYMKFIEQRMSAIKDLTANSKEVKVDNRPVQVRNKMEEFTRLVDELQDNLDNYDQEHADIRKSLKDLVSASAKWEDVLNKPAIDEAYDFARKTALNAAQSINDQAKKLQDEQEKYFAKHKDQRGKNGTGPD